MAQLDKTAVDAVSAEMISAFVQQRLAEKAVLINTIDDRSNEVGFGMDSLNIGRSTAFTAEDKVEGTEYTSQGLTWSVDKLALDKQQGVYVEATRKGIQQSSIDQEMEVLSAAADGLVKKLEAAVYAQLILASASAPDHRIAFDTSSTLALSDILEARSLLRIQEVPFEDNDTFLAINPAQESQLLSLEQFIDASRYGNAMAITRGEIGMVYGFRVIVSNSVTAATAIAYHRSHVAFARQGQVSWEVSKLLKDSVNQYLLEQVYGVKVLDSGKRGVLMNNAGA